MREQNDALEQALAAIAVEETKALVQQMTFSDMQSAKKMQQDYSKQNLSLIRKHTHVFRPAPLLRAAAAIILVAGSLMLLRSSMPEKADLSAPAAPALPMYTNSISTTSAPEQETIAPNTPTSMPVINIFDIASATPVPHRTAEPTTIPTPVPTVTPSPVPTTAPTPAATPAPVPAAQHPDGWQGRYFPAANPAGWTLKPSGGNTAVYDDNYEFTEYDRITQSAARQEIAEYQYVMINGIPALLTEDQAGQFTLTWDVDGQTLSLFSPDGEKETLLGIANSVVKLPEN